MWHFHRFNLYVDFFLSLFLILFSVPQFSWLNHTGFWKFTCINIDHWQIQLHSDKNFFRLFLSVIFTFKLAGNIKSTFVTAKIFYFKSLGTSKLRHNKLCSTCLLSIGYLKGFHPLKGKKKPFFIKYGVQVIAVPGNFRILWGF